MDEERVAMQERGLRALHENGGFQFTDKFFPYTSGEVGPYYVQSGVVMNNGADYDMACKDIVDLVMGSDGNRRYDFIAGGESRDWIFSPHVARDTQTPHLMIYKNGKFVGHKDIDGKTGALVCDLNNEGSSPEKLWVPAITGLGGKVEDIFFYVDRMEGGVQVMKDLGLNSQAVVPLDKYAWEYLQQIGAVKPTEYDQLVARGTDKDSRDKWAVGMLGSEVGLEELARLYDDGTGRSKVEKIMKDGYPDLNTPDFATEVSRFTADGADLVKLVFEGWKG